MKLFAFFVAFAALVFGFSRTAEAYVTYNRLGYVSCAACHFTSTGGGLITPYGAGVQGSMAAFPKEVMPDDKRFFHGIEARAIELDSTKGANPFLMQADYLANAQLTETLHFDGQIGLNLKQGTSEFAKVPSGWDGVAVRRALFAAELKSGDSIEVGRDAAVAGLNIDDHTSYLRLMNRRGELDYPTQIRYVYQTESLQLLPYVDLPSFEESETNREYGGGIRSEYVINASNSAGLEGLYGDTTRIRRTSLGGFFRLSQAHWNGFAGEYLLTRFSPATGDSFTQQNFYLKPYVAIPEWIETGFVYEHLSVSNPFDQTSYQYGPSVNARITRFVSLLGDGRNFNVSGKSNWSWYGQVYLHVEI